MHRSHVKALLCLQPFPKVSFIPPIQVILPLKMEKSEQINGTFFFLFDSEPHLATLRTQAQLGAEGSQILVMLGEPFPSL